MKTVLTFMNKKFTLLFLGIIVVAIAGTTGLIGNLLLVDIVTFALVSLAMALGLQIFMGNSGLLSWTYIGFVGIGAFVSSICSMNPMIKGMAIPNLYPFLKAITMHPVLAILTGAAVAGIIAAVIAWPLMRLSDAVGVITQFAALIVINVVLTQWDNVTNGPRTVFGVTKFTTLWIALAGALIVLAAAYFFKESRIGLRLRASRDDRHAATAIGINMVSMRYLTFIVSSMLGGFAGGLWAHYITSFTPKTFYITEMFVLIGMLVIGGSRSVTGAVLGTILITALRQGLRQVENSFGFAGIEVYGLTEISLSIIMVIILIWLPLGLSKGREITWESITSFGKRKQVPETDADTCAPA